MTEDRELRSAESRAIADRLREELARRRVSRQAVADMARISLSTLEKALSGARPFTLATVVRIEDSLGVALRPKAEAKAGPATAPDAMGAYSRAAVKWIEGDYVTLRPSFSNPGAIYSYRIRIAWDEAAGHLVFSEMNRDDEAFSQAGFVSVPTLSGHVYLMTSEEGQYRMILLGRATRERRMYGILSTLQVGSGSQLVPVACPIVLAPVDQLADAPSGIVSEGEERFAELSALLGRALGADFCRLRQ